MRNEARFLIRPLLTAGALVTFSQILVMGAEFSAKLVEQSRAGLGGAWGFRLPENLATADVVGAVAENPMSAAMAIDWEALYLRGAFVAKVWGPGDNVARLISLKLRSLKDSSGNVYEKLAVCDVSYQSDTFCQTYQVGASLDTTAPLDDRQPGWPDYTLRISFTTNGGTIITFGRPGHEDQMKTTLRRLFTLRAQQALDEGTPVEIDGRSFIVLGQGGAAASLLYFPGDLRSRMGSDDIFKMAPDMMADVGVRGADGRTQRVQGKAPLGWVNGRYYYLIFDLDRAYWIPTL